MEISYKALFSAIAIGLTLYAFFPYIRSIRREATRPHVFSWLIWGSTTFIVFLAQLEDGGGIGAWPVGVSGVITLYITWLAYVHRADVSITTVDWLFLVAAMASLPLWYVTANPLWAVIILTSVDVFGFGPTVRKAWHQPYSEQPGFYTLFLVRNLMVVLALENYSLTTVLFPAVIATACLLLVLMILWRRQRLSA